MILRPLHPAETYYRFITPRWSHTPTSGAGAARFGGRFNRPGTDAIYLSVRIETAAAEYQQDDPLIPPGTLVAYRVALSRFVDFRAAYAPGVWDELWADWCCEWRRQSLYEQIEPPSWLLVIWRSSAARRVFYSPLRDMPAAATWSSTHSDSMAAMSSPPMILGVTCR